MNSDANILTGLTGYKLLENFWRILERKMVGE